MLKRVLQTLLENNVQYKLFFIAKNTIYNNFNYQLIAEGKTKTEINNKFLLFIKNNNYENKIIRNRIIKLLSENNLINDNLSLNKIVNINFTSKYLKRNYKFVLSKELLKY